ncbi:MAG: hypothetical protein H6R13_2113 [Proteobacteria bacterium]|nr:hypothetical protein [Pseudomonadota bacterium]
MNDIQIVYTSKATANVDDAQLDNILKSAVRNNAARNITGMLLYAKGSFLQVLEGEVSVIEALLKQLEADTRHRDVEIIVRTSIKGHEFKNWSMGYRRLHDSDAKALLNYAPFFEDGFDASKFCEQPGLSLDILKALAAQLDQT